MDEPGITPFVEIFVSVNDFLFLIRVAFLGQNVGQFRYGEQTKCFCVIFFVFIQENRKYI